MNKKEIYEHLADIYLDASYKSTKKKRKTKTHPKSLRNIFIVGVVLFLSVGSTFVYSKLGNQNRDSQTALFLFQDTAKINFNFDPAHKETFDLNLKQLNLSKYKTLGFAVRKTNPKDIISLRVEFINRFNEKSEYYVKDISSKWMDHKIDFKYFAKMNDWDQMRSLTFSIEEWNAREKSGIVYIDNIRVLK